MKEHVYQREVLEKGYRARGRTSNSGGGGLKISKVNQQCRILRCRRENNVSLNCAKNNSEEIRVVCGQKKC